MNNLRYVLYARKSSEGNERQVQSIDDQVSEMTTLAKSLGLNIAFIETESKSAKAPYARPVFERIIKLLQSGEANAILCWNVDRLSRNAVDSGLVSHLLQNEVIKEIRTFSRLYLPTDNALVLSVDTGSANQYVRDLSVNTKRGLKSKVEKGWYPGVPPAGYKNDLSTQTIVLDDERAPMIREAFDMILSGASISEVRQHLNDDLHYRTIKRKHSGGNPMGRSTLYEILRNPFYAGYFRWNGDLIKGSHPPIVTFQEHRIVTEKIAGKPNPRPKGDRVPLAYRGMMSCGYCSCVVTGEVKHKKGRMYTYYHCTHRKTTIICKQPSITENDIEDQAIKELLKYNIHPQFLTWAADALGEIEEQDAKLFTKQAQKLTARLDEVKNELSELLGIRTRGLIDDDEYINQKTSLIKEREDIKTKIEKLDNKDTSAQEVISKLNFISKAVEKFENGNHAERKELLAMLGQKLTLKDKELDFTPVKWLIPIRDNYSTLERQFFALEPKKNQSNISHKSKKTPVGSSAVPFDKLQTLGLNSLNSTWLRQLGSNQRPNR